MSVSGSFRSLSLQKQSKRTFTSFSISSLRICCKSSIRNSFHSSISFFNFSISITSQKLPVDPDLPVLQVKSEFYLSLNTLHFIPGRKFPHHHPLLFLRIIFAGPYATSPSSQRRKKAVWLSASSSREIFCP